MSSLLTQTETTAAWGLTDLFCNPRYGGSVASFEASWNLTGCKSFNTIAEDCLPRDWRLGERKHFNGDVPLWEYQAVSAASFAVLSMVFKLGLNPGRMRVSAGSAVL